MANWPQRLMSWAFRLDEARSCLETLKPESCSWLRAQLCMQIMAWTWTGRGSEPSLWPGHADSGASRRSQEPDAEADAGMTKSAHATTSRAMIGFRAIPCQSAHTDVQASA